MKSIILSILFVSLAISTFAQDEDSYTPTRKLQSSYIFNQYNPNDVDVDEEKQRIEAFVMQVKDTNEYAAGRIYVYRGVNDYNFNADKRRTDIGKTLTSVLKDNSIESNSIYAGFVGFRQESTVEMVVYPSFYETQKPYFAESISNIRYYDEPALPKGVIQKTWGEISKLFTVKIEAKAPAAARAVRAVGEVVVLIKIDEKGNVTEAESIIGHVLLRRACEDSLKESKFEPQKQNEISIKVVAMAVCSFEVEQ